MSNQKSHLDELYTILLEEGSIKNKNKARYYHNFLFRDINLSESKVLDIGGGRGVLSLYAATMGAKRVICLEPESDGSTPGASNSFERIKIKLGLNNVFIESQTFQVYQPGNTKFDVIVLHNSINHIDEDACVNLLEHENARKIYLEHFKKINLMSSSHAQLIICDCSRHNFFGIIGIKNPFVSSIEWHKHQTPETWVALLSEVGFYNPRVRWTSFSRLNKIGWLLAGNKLISFFLKSHFCLTMDKQ